MHSLANPDVTLASVPGAIVSLLRRIDLGAGSEALYRNQVPELLVALAERARGESITSSSAIEGVTATPARARMIIEGRGSLRTRDEQQLAGYREALDYLLIADWQPLHVGLLLHLHRLLWSHTATSGGHLKGNDNLVVDRHPDGTTEIRFRPVPAAMTPFFLNELVARFNDAAASERHHPVLLVGLFVLDLTVIHPFDDGNGRVARLITNALLAQAGYGVGQSISLEHLVAESADAYYDQLRASTTGWHEDSADVWPWLEYFTRTLAIAYERFVRRVSSARFGGSKQDRVRTFVVSYADPIFQMSDVRAALPGISDNTIRIVLNALRSEGKIDSTGTGRSAAWRKLGR